MTSDRETMPIHDTGPMADDGRPVGIVLFDGTCRFCNGTVQFLIDRDPQRRLRFASLQSDAGRRLLAERGLPVTEEPDTMVYLEGGGVFLRSDAAIAVARRLAGGWRLLAAVRLVPRFLRDWGYRTIARNRHRWFGRTDACRVPTPDLVGRFLD